MASSDNRPGLNGAALPFANNPDSSSSDARQRLQELRENSFEDSSDFEEGFGAIGSTSTRPAIQGEDFAGHGGPVQLGNFAPQAPDDYGVPVASSSAQGHVNVATAPAPVLLQPASSVHSAPVQALIAAGPVNVDMSVEASLPNANSNSPAFLHGTNMLPATRDEWFNIVLPFIMNFVFTFTSTTDLFFGAQMWASRLLPSLHLAVTRLNFPGFHWFSGVNHNRHHNPYWQMVASLNGVRELTFRLHTAGTTTSAYGERDMIRIERTDPRRAAERRPLSLQEVVHRYEMNGLFACHSLRHIRIEYTDSAHIRGVVRSDPIRVLRDLQQYLINGFGQMNLVVVVELVPVVLDEDEQ